MIDVALGVRDAERARRIVEDLCQRISQDSNSRKLIQELVRSQSRLHQHSTGRILILQLRSNRRESYTARRERSIDTKNLDFYKEVQMIFDDI